MSLDATGLSIKRLNELVQDLGVRARSPEYFGPGFAVEPDTPNGQLIGLFAEALATAWEGLAEVYAAFDPNAAEKTQLDNLCSLVGVTRELATHSQVVLRFEGPAGTVIPAGSVARVPNGPAWATKLEATIGVSASLDVDAEAQVTGAIEAEADTITEMVTGVFGIDSVTNPAEAVAGRALETDAELRVRRARSLQAPSAGTEQAIRARLEQLEEVVNATVVSNRTLAVDTMGLPPKSFRAYVWPEQSGEGREAVARAIWETMPAGIYCDGSEELSVTDDQGYEQAVRFSYATELELSVDVTAIFDDETVVGSHLYPPIIAAVLAYGDALRVGDDVLPTKLIVAIMAAVPGIDDLEVRVGTSTRLAEPFEVAAHQIAVFDSARVFVGIS